MDASQIDAVAFWLRLFEALLTTSIVDDMTNIGSNKHSECMEQVSPISLSTFSEQWVLIDTNDVDVRDISSIRGLDDIALELRHHRAVVAVMALDKARDTLVETSVMRQGRAKIIHGKHNIARFALAEQ